MSYSQTPATWFLTEALFLITLSLCCAVAFAQTPAPKAGDGVRGSTPPGMSQDGARPADGALKGGSPILPGESAGIPNKDDPVTKDTRIQRCDELSGSLREQCLEKDRDAATGATTAPRSPSEILKKP